MQRYQGMGFYEHNYEHNKVINLPKSFELIAEYDGGYIFSNHTMVG